MFEKLKNHRLLCSTGGLGCSIFWCTLFKGGGNPPLLCLLPSQLMMCWVPTCTRWLNGVVGWMWSIYHMYHIYHTYYILYDHIYHTWSRPTCTRWLYGVVWMDIIKVNSHGLEWIWMDMIELNSTLIVLTMILWWSSSHVLSVELHGMNSWVTRMNTMKAHDSNWWSKLTVIKIKIKDDDSYFFLLIQSNPRQ